MPVSAYNSFRHTETEKTVHSTVFFAGKNLFLTGKRHQKRTVRKGTVPEHRDFSSGEKEHIERDEEQSQQERHTVDCSGVFCIGPDGSGKDGHIRHGGHSCLGEKDLGGNGRNRNEGEEQENAERGQDEPADHGAHKVPVEMNGREGNTAHLHADHKESQRRCRISHILHGGQKEVRQADIQQDQRYPGEESHQGRRAEFFQDI